MINSVDDHMPNPCIKSVVSCPAFGTNRTSGAMT